MSVIFETSHISIVLHEFKDVKILKQRGEISFVSKHWSENERSCWYAVGYNPSNCNTIQPCINYIPLPQSIDFRTDIPDNWQNRMVGIDSYGIANSKQEDLLPDIKVHTKSSSCMLFYLRYATIPIGCYRAIHISLIICIVQSKSVVSLRLTLMTGMYLNLPFTTSINNNLQNRTDPNNSRYANHQGFWKQVHPIHNC